MSQTFEESKKREVAKLFELFASIDDPKDFEKLFLDLCTFKEIEQMAVRLNCAKLLLKGCTYIKIMEDNEISSATLSRVSRCIQYGSGGYNGVLEKYNALQAVSNSADNKKD